MGFWQKLFGKKSKGLGEDDGQAQYFMEDFQPVKKATKYEKATEAKKPEPEKKDNINVEPKKEKAVKKPVSKKAEEEINENSPEVKSADKVKEGKQTKNGRSVISFAEKPVFFTEKSKTYISSFQRDIMRLSTNGGNSKCKLLKRPTS